MTEVALTEKEELEREQAFHARITQLYDLYEDWTGEREEGEEPANEQEDGSPLIEAGEAFSTFALFTLRLAADLGITSEQLDQVLAEMRENIEQEEGDDDDETTEPRAKAG